MPTAIAACRSDRHLGPSRCLLAILASAMLAAALAGCNTMHGAGKDVEKAGEAVQDAAD